MKTWKYLNPLFLLGGMVLLSLSLQAQISSYPHISSFEDQLQCITGCNTICPLNGTWQNESNDDIDWLNDRSGTPSGGTGPSQDHTFGTSQGYYLYVESSCNNIGYPNKRADLVSAYFDFTGLNDTVLLSFWYHMRGTTMGDLHLDADTSQGSSPWIEDIIPSITDNQNLWQRRLVDLGSFMGLDSVRFRFRCITGTNFSGDMALDDIDFFLPQEVDLEVTAIPAPLSGCNLGNAEPVTVTVFNHGNRTFLPGDTLRLCYQADLNAPVVETFTLTDTLFPSGELDFTFAQGADVSAIGPHTIVSSTKMSPLGSSHNREKSASLYHHPVEAQYPYAMGFENGPANWRVEGINSTWALGTPTKAVINGAANGSNCWSTGIGATNYNNAENAYVISPCFDFTNLCRPELRLNLAWECENTWDGAVLQYSLNGGQSWTRVGNSGDPNNWFNSNDIFVRPGGQAHGWTGTQADGNGSGGWVAGKRTLFNLAGEPDVLMRMVFGSDNGVNGEGFAFDDFVISNGVYLGPDRSICLGDTTVLDADSIAGDTYLWSTGATTRTLAVTTPGIYSVEVFNNSYCTTTDTIEIFGVNSGLAVSLGADTAACGSLGLDAGFSPGFSYLWSTGAMGQILTVDSTGSYFVDVTTPCGVVRSDTQLVQILPLPALELGADTTVCAGITLVADSGAASYNWSTGASGPSLAVSSSGVYAVTATSGDGCTSTDSIAIDVAGFPSADLGADTILCPGDSLCLQANPNPGLGYTWTTGALVNEICIGSGGVYAVTVTNADNCSQSDTVFITTPPNPDINIVADTSGCPTLNFFGNSTGGPVDSWFWDFGDGDTSSLQNPSHFYAANGLYFITLIASNACGSDTGIFQFPLICEVGLWEAFGGKVEVFPNPVDQILNVKWEALNQTRFDLLLRDLQGRVVLPPEQFNGRINAHHQLDLGRLSRGVYFLEMRADDQVLRSRIVKN